MSGRALDTRSATGETDARTTHLVPEVWDRNQSMASVTRSMWALRHRRLNAASRDYGGLT